MEGGGGSGTGGRYEEKAGGQQVASLFHEATDNERLKAVYGNYSLWSWLRYRWLDTESYVTWMSLDKGYYDYDYERPSARTSAAMGAATSDEQMEADLKRMGLKVRHRKATAEQLQADVLNEAKGAAPA